MLENNSPAHHCRCRILYHSHSMQQWLIPALQAIKGLFDVSFQVWSVWWKVDDFDLIGFAECSYHIAGKVIASIGAEPPRKPLRGPLLRGDIYSIPMAKLHFIRRRIGDTGQYRITAAGQSHIDARNKPGGHIYCHIDIRPPYRLPIVFGDKIDVSNRSIYFIKADILYPAVAGAVRGL